MPDKKKFVCIHGHFYQPPRENPWLETIETQDSASPYHDWNERITAECYAPNGAARIVNSSNEITRILNNYARMSFNFGPTLLSWMEENANRSYRNILKADRRSQVRFSGHGSALAQVYNHIIMPLASTRDRITQIRWGIADFKSRFGREPEGMWLAETAVDSETLELLADNGIKFTILAPHQCARVRPLRSKSKVQDAAKGADLEDKWELTPGASVDTTHPYLVRFPSGKSIAIFFYDGPRSRAVAFEGILNSGEGFANRLIGGFSDTSEQEQLVHVATDGESYGHHHRHGEMALCYALQWIEQQNLARLTNYGEFLEKFPPKYEAQIEEDTSWSCMHGVERWRSNCGCNGGKVGWNQEWRAPLRDALDWLRDAVAPLTEKLGNMLFYDVWAARDAYIEVVLERSPAAVERFFAAHANHKLSSYERIQSLELMELQRHTQLMYTSCGWFFDDLAGIETVQIIAYAGRVLQLALDLFGPLQRDLEAAFIKRLTPALCNDPKQGNGGDLYERRVKAMQVGLEQVAAHYAILSVFSNDAEEESKVFSYNVRRLSYQTYTSGRGRLALGRAMISSRLTYETEPVFFAALHFGDQNITAAVKRDTGSGAEEFLAFSKAIGDCVASADFPEVVRLFDRFFGTVDYTIASLFTDEQRRILKIILTSTLSEVEASLCTIYEDHASLLHFLSRAGLPKPPALMLAAGFAINAGLRRALESEPVDAPQVRALLAFASADQIQLDSQMLSYLADQRMKRSMLALYANFENMEVLDGAVLAAKTLRELPFELNLWQAQNIWYDTLRLSLNRARSLSPDVLARWTTSFHQLGECLFISVDDLVVEEEPAQLPVGSVQLSKSIHLEEPAPASETSGAPA
jgi:alpha-amylase/alpha-mannosidase (GH57 family)